MRGKRHLREALIAYLDTDLPPAMCRISHNGEDKTIDWLIGQLWNCTDVIPFEDCERLKLFPGSTYAQQVRRMKRPFGDMHYIRRVPRKVPSDYLLCHNHVKPASPLSRNGFRAWLVPVSRQDHYEVCPCKWSGLTHYRVAHTE